MRWLGPGVAALALATASPSSAQGMNCAKAATPLERTICADPRLKEADATLGTAYANALKSFGGAIAAYVRADQRAWLRSFKLIGAPGEDSAACDLADRKCVLDQIEHRSAVLFSVSFQHSGVYLGPRGLKLLLTPTRANGYGLRVFHPADAAKANIATGEGDGKWDGPQFMLAKMGDANGLPLPNPGDGPDPDGCTLRMLPAALQIRVWQTGYCLGRDWSGVYRRDLMQTLEAYEKSLD